LSCDLISNKITVTDRFSVVALYGKETKMLKCCQYFVLWTSLILTSFVTLGCGGGDDDNMTTDPADAVTPTDNPDDEPLMEEGP
jgi:hypothetical protein